MITSSARCAKIVLAALYSRCEFRLANTKPLRTVRRAITLAPSEGVPVVMESRVRRPVSD